MPPHDGSVQVEMIAESLLFGGVTMANTPALTTWSEKTDRRRPRLARQKPPR